MPLGIEPPDETGFPTRSTRVVFSNAIVDADIVDIT